MAVVSPTHKSSDSISPTLPTITTGKRPAGDATATLVSRTTLKKCRKLAKDYLTGDIKEACLSFRLVIQAKANVSSDTIALLKLGELLHTLQKGNSTIAILPWYIRNRASLPPLLDHSSSSFMEHAKFRTKYAHPFNPKFNQACWFNIAVAHMCSYQHLLSDDDSNNASWYRDNDCKAYLAAVQGSNDTVPLGELLYSGPFMNASQITAQIQQICAAKCKAPLRFGCRVSKNLKINLSHEKFRNWLLAENQLVKIDVDRKDAKRLKVIMYAYVNK